MYDLCTENYEKYPFTPLSQLSATIRIVPTIKIFSEQLPWQKNFTIAQPYLHMREMQVSHTFAKVGVVLIKSML